MADNAKLVEAFLNSTGFELLALFGGISAITFAYRYGRRPVMIKCNGCGAHVPKGMVCKAWSGSK